MLPPPKRQVPYSWHRQPLYLSAGLLLALAGGCGGGDGGIEPPAPHPTRLALVVQPSALAQSRVTLAAQPVVQLQDDDGAAVSQAGVPVTVAVTTGGGTLTGATTINTSSTGQAAFTQLSIGGLAGPRTLTFTSPDLAPVTSGTIDLSSGAAATISKNGGDIQTAATGNAVAVAPSVMVTDADNNRVSGVPVTFQVTSGAGTVDPTTPVNTDLDGIATVTSWVLGSSPGANTLSASAAGVAGPPVIFGATGIGGTSTITGTISVNTSSLMARIKSSIPGASFSLPLLPRTKVSRPLGGTLLERSNRSALRQRQLHPAPEYTANELIVTFRARPIGVPPMGSAALASQSTAAAAGASIRARLVPHMAAEHSTVTGVSPAVLTARIRVPEGADLKRIAGVLRADPAVATVSRNHIIRLEGDPSGMHTGLPVMRANDPLYSFQAWHYGLIDAPEAWAISTGSSSVLVAVVDDGIRFDHPAISANLTADGYDFVSNNSSVSLCAGGSISISGDGDGYDPDPTNPIDYAFDPDLRCLFGPLENGNHGLHVAGTIGAVGNDAFAVTGINWRVSIRPVRVIGVGGGTAYDVAQGILYAAGLPADDGLEGIVQAPTGAKIINLSLGGPAAQILGDAVTAASEAGALIISSAGNTGLSAPSYPAAYPEVLSVSAVGPDGQLASYSSFGSTIDIAAPGGDFSDGDGSFGVMSTTWNFVTGSPSYDVHNGTSMAAPHVAGVAALILATSPGLSSPQLRSRLLDFAVDAGPDGPDNRYGAGIVNARNSLAQNLAPTRQLRARLYDALTGSVLQTVPASGGGSYSFTGVTNGKYQVFAGQDEAGDQVIGTPGRRWGAFGGAANATSINVNSTKTYQASFSIGIPSEVEPNGTLSNADILPVGGYFTGTTEQADIDVYRVLIPQAGQYTFETSPVDGACGFALEEDTLLGLYDANGALITSNDDIAPNGFNFCSGVTASLAPGTYHVSIQGYFGGSYRVQARSGL